MPTLSLRTAAKSAAVVAAVGALTGVAAAGSANAEPIQGIDTGSLGSLSGLFVSGANENVGGSLATLTGSAAGMEGSATNSVSTGSLQGAQAAAVAGSSTGSAGSIGQLAQQIDGTQLENTASVTMSADGSNMLTVVTPGSATGLLQSASLGLQAVTPTP